jgi:hypothetical protein
MLFRSNVATYPVGWPFFACVQTSNGIYGTYMFYLVYDHEGVP